MTFVVRLNSPFISQVVNTREFGRRIWQFIRSCALSVFFFRHSLIQLKYEMRGKLAALLKCCVDMLVFRRLFLCGLVIKTCSLLLTCSKELFLQSEAKSRLAAQIAAKYDWRGPNRGLVGESRPKPSFLNTVNQV